MKLLLAVLAPILFFIGVELVLRVCNVGYHPHFVIQHEVKGVPYWVENEKFGWRFFHPAIARTPEPISLPVEKGLDEFRVLVLGGSAAQGDPAPEFGAARMLEVMLRDALPAKKVTVINAAMTAVNSHVVKVIAGDAQVLEPDAIIVYMGNNEVIGPYGAASATYPWQRSDLWIGLHTKLTGTRTGQLLQRLMQGVTPLNFKEWKGMEMFLEQRVAMGDSRLDNTYRQFVANLNEILEGSGSTPGRLFLNTVAVNLESLGPFAGDDAGEAERLFLAGHEGKDIELLKQSRDMDELRFRADSKINKLLHRIAEENEAVELIDVEERFIDEAGFETFVDHVHFGWTGNVQVATLWLSHLAEAFDISMPGDPASGEALRSALGFDGSEEQRINRLVLERWRRVPFIHSTGWADAMVSLTAESLEKPKHNSFDAPLDSRDYYRWIKEAEVAMQDGDLNAALTIILDVRECWPLDREAIILQSRILGQSGRLRKADDLLQAYDYLFAGKPGKRQLQIANACLNSRQFEQAQKWFDLASRSTHQKAEVALGRGMMAASRGEQQVAINYFVKALDADPTLLQARNNLLALWPLTGEVGLIKAIKLGAELVAEDPNHAEFRYNYGLALLKGNRSSEAAAEFISALQTRPDFWPAARELAQIYLRLERWESMLRVTELFDQLIPEDSDLLQLRGFAHARQERVEEAKASFNKAVE